MSILVANVPPIKTWIRKEYLYDELKGHGEYTPAIWVTVKSIPGRAFYIEAFLPEYGALFDKLPISAFLMWESDYPDKPREIERDMDLPNLQFWNCFDRGITVLEKSLVFNCSIQARTRNFGSRSCDYLFTIDSYHIDSDGVDLTFAETPEEHKSFNFVVFDNSQIGCYPNNRLLWSDPSLTPAETKRPDFLVSSRYYEVENMNHWSQTWGTLGDSSEYFWETKNEAEFPAGSIDLDLDLS